MPNRTSMLLFVLVAGACATPRERPMVPAAPQRAGPANDARAAEWQRRLAALPDCTVAARLVDEQRRRRVAEDRLRSVFVDVSSTLRYSGHLLAHRGDRLALHLSHADEAPRVGDTLVVFDDRGFKAGAYLAEVDGEFLLAQVMFAVDTRSVAIGDRFCARRER